MTHQSEASTEDYLAPQSSHGVKPPHGVKTPHGLWRILAPAFVCWALTAALIHTPGAARVVALCAAVIGIGACVYACVHGRDYSLKGQRAGARNKLLGGAVGVVLIASAATTLLGARIDVLERARASELLIQASEGAGQVSMRATIAGYPEAIDGFGGETRAWVRAEIRTVESWDLPRPVPVMLWLSTPPPETWSAGTRVTLSGVLKRQPPESRAAYDISVRDITEDLESSASRAPLEVLARLLTQLPAQLRQTLREAASKQPSAELVPGLAVGDTSLVGQPLEDLMIESSLSHLVAVSGSNCALVIVAATAASSRLGAGRRARIFVAAGALGAFVVLVGPDASVQRAAIMASVLLLSNFSSKSRQALPSLGLAILTLLVIDPWQSIQAGFALSVMATAGILIGVSPLETWLRTQARLPRILALPVAVASIAQFACAPLLLLLQPGLPVSGVVANILAAPAAPVGTALGMVTMLLLPLHAGIGEVSLWFAIWPARWIEASGAFSVSLPMGRWYWPGGWSGTLLLGVVEILIVAVWIMTGGSRLIGPWRGKLRRSVRDRVKIRLVAGIAVGLVAAVVIVVPVTVSAGVPRDWFMVACDVGQGDAILLRDPNEPDTVMLVDTGDDPAMLSACLDLFGVRQIELLVLTHDHRDHYGALPDVLPRTSKVLVAPPALEHEQSRPVVHTIEASETPFGIGEAGDVGGSESGMKWQIIGPRQALSYGEANATCLVLLVDVAGIRTLLLADTGEEEQQWLAQEYPALDADVVKVAHHGSRDQAARFYEQLGADVSVISVGDNRYGHPNGALIDGLFQSGAAVLRTDELGSIALSVENLDGSEALRVVPWAAGERTEVSGGVSVGGSR